MNKKENKKKQFFIFGLCSFLALVLCMVTLVVTVKNVEKEQNTPVKKQESEEVYLENNEDELFWYISAVTRMALDPKDAKVNMSTSVSIDDNTILVDGEQNSKDVALFVYFKNRFLDKIDALYGDDYIGEFGVAYDKMPEIMLSQADARCNMTKGLADEQGNPVLDDNGEVVDKDYYFLSFVNNGAKLNEKAEKAYGMKNIPAIKDEVVQILSEECKVNSLEAEPQDFRINAKVNVHNDRLSYVEYKYVYKVTARVEFINKLAVFGEKEISFDYVVTRRFDYFFSYVEFLTNELYLDVGEEAQLTVNAVIEDDSEYTVKFISNNEDLVSIDEMGYVKALAESDEPASVVVVLEYLGKEKSDECFVYIGKDKGE